MRPAPDLNHLGVALVDAGIAAGALGLLSLALPAGLPGIRTRKRAAILAGVGGLMGLAGAALPAPSRRSNGTPTLLDSFVPVFEFNEFHQTRVNAQPERVYEAMLAVTAGEIRLFELLTWIRSPRLPWSRSRAESILNAPADRPILDVATSSGFCKLAEAPGLEIVIGMAVIRPKGVPPIATPAQFMTRRRGFALAAMSFRVEAESRDRCRLTTETRIHATDGLSRKRFAAYWRLIYPGSSLIRVQWLKAIRERAESSS